jgi:hypothetical protein
VETELPAVPGKKVGDVVGLVGCSVAWWDAAGEKMRVVREYWRIVDRRKGGRRGEGRRREAIWTW